ncbi:MAG TPA: hypothetical protein VJ992_09265 [Gemmatimonadales bacterium]|nr:hypothetical protein [Gemmatimonadales bacterium]
MRKYLIWSYDYQHASAGPKTLHKLCHELNQAGQEAYVGRWATNPEWNTPVYTGELDDDWVAVYPEVVRGNPWRSFHVARWVLNVPGRLGGDRTYDPREMVFSFSGLFSDAPLLHLPAVETEIYTDRGEPRSGALSFTGRSTRSRPVDAREITLAERQDRYALADVLNHAEVLYAFEMLTGVIDIARLCGCPVIVVPNGAHTREEYDREVGWNGIGWDEMPTAFDPAAFRADYLSRLAAFPAQLARFVEVTQA